MSGSFCSAFPGRSVCSEKSCSCCDNLLQAQAVFLRSNLQISSGDGVIQPQITASSVSDTEYPNPQEPGR